MNCIEYFSVTSGFVHKFFDALNATRSQRPDTMVARDESDYGISFLEYFSKDSVNVLCMPFTVSLSRL